MATILFADDDQALRDLARRALESDGHHVVVVPDGGEALQVMKSDTPPDVLVSDVDMPVMDGITLAQQALAAKPDLRVLMISGMTDRLEGIGSLPTQALATLDKPFSLEALREAVAKLLG